MAFSLTTSERMSPLWQRLEEHFRAELAAVREQNDAPGKTHDETQVLRGRIAQLKRDIALGEPQREPIES